MTSAKLRRRLAQLERRAVRERFKKQVEAGLPRDFEF